MTEWQPPSHVTCSYNASCVTSQRCVTDFFVVQQCYSSRHKAYYVAKSENYEGITMDWSIFQILF